MSEKSRWKAIIVLDEDEVIEKTYDLDAKGRLKKPFKKKKKNRFDDYKKVVGPKVCFPYNVSPHQISNREIVPDIPAHRPCRPTQSYPADNPERNHQELVQDDRSDTLQGDPLQGGDNHESHLLSPFGPPSSPSDYEIDWEIYFSN